MADKEPPVFIGEKIERPGSVSCPNCGDEDVVLGPSAAYVICSNPACLSDRRGGRDTLEVYWLGDYSHPEEQGRTWEEALEASPWESSRG